ncbi:hypothetical protein KFL_007560030 [Klebsormidium nitens]|uniref:Protein kinase domain-containing protein n=1 Tax=Klebsormidium nitens TaxID=105231 RepID=A0A1Y1IK82_KLENI|nr:hypothetical protein KFL_007560030 [Klebsormidium nitens]|eukprot:GAQ91275.1 hypothetical protein KFL_007560030 [Klebsormidium nitens]
MASAQLKLTQLRADAASLAVSRTTNVARDAPTPAWSSSHADFMGPTLQLVAGPGKRKRAPAHSCQALALPDAVTGLVAAGVSAIGLSSGASEWAQLLRPPEAVLAPLASLDDPAQWRTLAAAALTLWYITAKPGPIQGVLDIMWAPVAEMNATSFDPACITIGKQLGEGSFGVVFEGWVAGPRGRTRVVLKKVKAKVSGADEMRTSELYFNKRLQRSARGSCADFLGTCQVDRAMQKGKLVEGTWLIWRYQGSANLESFLRRRDFPAALAGDLLGERGVTVRSTKEDTLQRDCAVVQAVCRHVLENLRAVHATGVVHRDVKPLNLVLDQETLRFTLVDLGACVDLRTGYNYVPDETIMDPIYCAPEQYILPINMPDAPPGPLMSLLAPLLFLAHTPDKFDLFSTGLVLMQLAVPTLRYDRNLAQFNVQLAASGYDLDKWRRSKLNFAQAELEILDANGGAGWDLARSLLRPRDGLWCPRPTARQALRHRFLTQSLRWATEPVPQPTKSGKKKAASSSGKKAREPVLAPALSFGWALGGRPSAEAPAEAASSSRGGGSLPFLNRSRSGPKLADAGAKFDRKVKLKATVVAGRAPQSAVAWSALLPLSTPFNAPAQPAAEAPRALAEPLRGLKRLVGLDAGALPVPPAREAVPPEFPHVAALAQLLRAAHLHQHVPVGLQPLARPQGGKARSANAQPQREPQRPRKLELSPAAQTTLRRVAQIGVPLAAASVIVAASGSMAVLAVKTSVETGYSMGQGLAQTLGSAALLSAIYHYVLRPGLPAGTLPPAYTTWLVPPSSASQGEQASPGNAGEGVSGAVREMEAQLASLEATIQGGHDFNVAQKQLLARVEALLLESTLQPPAGQAQVP